MGVVVFNTVYMSRIFLSWLLFAGIATCCWCQCRVDNVRAIFDDSLSEVMARGLRRHFFWFVFRPISDAVEINLGRLFCPRRCGGGDGCRVISSTRAAPKGGLAVLGFLNTVFILESYYFKR